MADYAFEGTAQQWNSDAYYVASSYPIYTLTVVATTKTEAVVEMKRLLGAPDQYRYWRIHIKSAKDVRLIPEPTEAPA